MSNFSFLESEWPDFHDAAARAEALVYVDSRAACFYARHVAAVEKLKAAHRASLSKLDALFAALQHRAFRGEL